MKQIIYQQQFLPISLDEAWDFFSTPHNLEKITPENMSFKILSTHKMEEVYPGQIITYKISPFLGIQMDWMTEITHVKDKAFFVDEQRFGPYKFWHHQHFFKAVDGGVLMEDLVHYKMPFGVLGTIAHALFIRKQLENIFNYRKKILADYFKAPVTA